jgi:predicted transglutaminase-like cysteine proteinase
MQISANPRRSYFGAGPFVTGERWEDLKEVNKTVKASIVPEPTTEGLAGEKWLINPASGDCHDSAVRKRLELLKRGWPASRAAFK